MYIYWYIVLSQGYVHIVNSIYLYWHMILFWMVRGWMLTPPLLHVDSQEWRWLASLYKGLVRAVLGVIQQEYGLRIDGFNVKWAGWLAKLSKYAIEVGHTDCHTWVVASMGFLTIQGKILYNPCARPLWWHQGHFESCGSAVKLGLATSYRMWCCDMW